MVLTAGSGHILTTTCRFCDENVGKWKELSELLSGSGLSLVALSLDNQRQTDAFLRQNAIDWEVLVPVSREVARQLGVRAVPMTVLVAASGQIEASWAGALTAEGVRGVYERAQITLRAALPQWSGE